MRNKPSKDSSHFIDTKDSHAVIELSANGYILNVSEKFLDLFRYSHESLLNQPHTILVHDSKDLDAKASYQSREFEAKRKDNTLFWARGVSYPIFNSTGMVERVIQFVYDISAEKAFRKLHPKPCGTVPENDSEPFISQTQKTAAHMTLENTEFLTHLSHEIRTPLTSILGTIELLSETKLDPTQEHYTFVLKRNGAALSSLISDVIDFSKIESKKIVLETIDYDFNEIVAEVLDIFSVSASEKKLKLSAIIQPDLNPFRRGDPNRIRQILVNLVGNAIKFTHFGEVQIRITGNQKNIECRVVDTGVGIAKNKIDLLFQKYSQISQPKTGLTKGTGLGLYISRYLTEMMGGSIRAEQNEILGMSFIFDLPTEARENSDFPFLKNILNGFDFKIVEPESQFASDTSNILESYGARLEITAHAIINCPQQVNALFVDTQLYIDRPMDLKTLVLNCSEKQKPIFVIFSSIKEAAEFNHPLKLIRPLKRGQIYKAIETAFPSVAQKREKTFHSISNLKVLIADDNADITSLIKAFLKNIPCELSFAKNGEEAVQFVKASQFDLVFMDLDMPVMDGHTAAQLIRDFERRLHLPELPIVALTGFATNEANLEGFNEHLQKPFKKEKLVQLLEFYSEKKSTGAA